jgi:hypothetical protein
VTVIDVWWEQNVSVSFLSAHLAGISICGYGTCPVTRVSKATILVSLAEIAVAFLSRSVYTSAP